MFDKVKSEEPDLFDMTVLGTILHSFYNGMENIFKLIAKNIDGDVPTGSQSHQELLHQMASENEKRNEILSEEQYFKVKQYATFRHFFRHSYSFNFNWDKMRPLIEGMDETWRSVKLSLEKFIES